MIAGAKHLQRFLDDPCLQSASIGFALKDLTKDSMSLEHQAELALPPASILKLLTTIRAIEELGDDFTFKTILGHNGTLHRDTLFGDLIIRGAGDPTLGSRHHPLDFEKLLNHWGQVVLTTGIKHITGDVIGDASYITKDRWVTAWPYEDLGNYYGAFPCGLNANDNACTVRFKQNQKLGSNVDLIDISPQVPNLHMRSMVTSGAAGSGDQAYIIGAPLQNERYITGTIPIGRGTFSIRGSLPDPPKFIAHHLKNQLVNQGVSVHGVSRSEYGYGGSIVSLDRMQSMSLAKIVQLTNQKSINLYAEGMGMVLDKLRSTAHLSSNVREFWLKRGIDLGNARMVDHCGLAPDNAISARAMVDILEYTFNEKKLWSTMLGSLPIAGETGTLRTMFRNSSARGQIFAKSGLINGVRNYAGYIKTKSGKWMAFCVMTANPTCSSQLIRKKLEQLLESLYLSLS